MRRKLLVETLENRSMLAGNVTASVSGADLIITGDALGNTITVESAGAGIVQVRGFENTSVNGTANGLKTFNVSGSINIRLNAGDDTVRVTNLVIQNKLLVDLGAGNNTALLGQSTAADNARFAGTPSGGLFIQGDQSVVGGTLADRVFQSNLHVAGAGTLSLGDGNDNVTLDRPTGSGANVEYGGVFSILPGAGTDGVSITGLVVDDNLVINDSSNATSVTINSMDVQGSLFFTSANFSDDVTITNTNVRNTLSIVSQAGYDTINVSAIAGRLDLNSGLGNDDVHISQSNIGVISAVLGGGHDELDLLSNTTNRIFAFGGDGDDLFLVRNTRAIDAVFNGEGGTDTYQDTALLPNSISNLDLISIERRQRT